MHELTDVIASDETAVRLVRAGESVVDGFISVSESLYELPALIDVSRIYQEAFDLKLALAEGQGMVFIRSEAYATPVNTNGDPIGPPVPVLSVGIQTNDKVIVRGETYLVEDMFDMSDEGFLLLAVRRQTTAGGTMVN